MKCITAVLGFDPFVAGTDKYRRNLHESGKFSVVLIKPELPVNKNRKNWKMKIPLRTKTFAWCLFKGVIITKDGLVKCNWHEGYDDGYF
jgi:hypothetical protein